MFNLWPCQQFLPKIAKKTSREVINIERGWSAVLLYIDDQIFVLCANKMADHPFSTFITSLAPSVRVVIATIDIIQRSL